MSFPPTSSPCTPGGSAFTQVPLSWMHILITDMTALSTLTEYKSNWIVIDTDCPWLSSLCKDKVHNISEPLKKSVKVGIRSIQTFCLVTSSGFSSPCWGYGFSYGKFSFNCSGWQSFTQTMEQHWTLCQDCRWGEGSPQQHIDCSTALLAEASLGIWRSGTCGAWQSSL